jgi:hypothetical protein
LQSVTGDSVFWGGATKNDYGPSRNKLTRLDAFVWHKLYLSLVTFSGTHTVEHLANSDDLLRLDVASDPSRRGARQKLIDKARAFSEAGDRALAYEKQKAQ